MQITSNNINQKAMDNILTKINTQFQSSNESITNQLEENVIDNTINFKNDENIAQEDTVIVYEFYSTFSITRIKRRNDIFILPDISTLNSFGLSNLLIQALSECLNKLNFNSTANTNNDIIQNIFMKYSYIDYAFISSVDKNKLLDNIMNANNKLDWTVYAKSNTSLDINEALSFLYESISYLYQTELNKPFYIEQTNNTVIEYYLNLGFNFINL